MVNHYLLSLQNSDIRILIAHLDEGTTIKLEDVNDGALEVNVEVVEKVWERRS